MEPACLAPNPFMTLASPRGDENARGAPGSAAILAARAGWKPALPALLRNHFQSTQNQRGRG